MYKLKYEVTNNTNQTINKLNIYSDAFNDILNECDRHHFLAAETIEALKDCVPVISVDTKKKENIGNFKNDGTEYRASGTPRPISDHDFFIPELGMIAPYGVYVLNDNAAFKNLGTSADTWVSL